MLLLNLPPLPVSQRKGKSKVMLFLSSTFIDYNKAMWILCLCLHFCFHLFCFSLSFSLCMFLSLPFLLSLSFSLFFPLYLPLGEGAAMSWGLLRLRTQLWRSGYILISHRNQQGNGFFNFWETWMKTSWVISWVVDSQILGDNTCLLVCL